MSRRNIRKISGYATEPGALGMQTRQLAEDVSRLVDEAAAGTVLARLTSRGVGAIERVQISDLLDEVITLDVQDDGTPVGSQSTLNLIAGKDIAITLAEDVAEQRVDATIARADKTLNSASASGDISFDLSGTGRHFRRTLTGNVTSIAISVAPVELGNWLFDFVQDSTPRTLPVDTADWPTDSTFTNSTPPVLATDAGGHNWVTLYYDGEFYHWLTGCNPSVEV